jgi:hypothetical protein
MMMKRITLTLIVGFCVVLAASAFAFDWLIDQQGYADFTFPTSDADEVWHGKVKEYVTKRVPPPDEEERWCRIGKRPVILSYVNNQVTHVRFGAEDFENPVLSADSIMPNVYLMYCFNKRLYVNFTKKEDIDALLDFCQSPPGFTMFAREYTRPYFYKEYKGDAVCYYRVEYPDGTVPKADRIRRWLLHYADNANYWDDDALMNYTPYLGDTNDKNAMARHFADRFFECTDQTFADTEFEYDMRVYDRNERYVTYQQFTYCYLGGIHGFNTERLASFDLTTGEDVTIDYLFKKECQQKVREVLMQTAFTDEKLCSWNNIETMEDVVRCFMPETMDVPDLKRVDISRVGLAPEGIVFSYYPYELSCFAAGCFHFTIPYTKLRPFLTEKAKHCIGLN